MSARRFIDIGTFAAVVALVTAPVQAQNIVNESEKALVKIVAKGTAASGEFKTVEGTGFFVHRDGFVLTALHVVKAPSFWMPSQTAPDGLATPKDRQILTTDMNGKTEKAFLVYYDERVDVALLRVPYSSPGVLRLGNSHTLRKTDLVVWLGFERNALKPGFGEGKVQEPIAVLSHGYQKFSGVTGLLKEGYSGGPLLSTRDAVVVGVLHAGFRDEAGVGIAIPINLAGGVLSMINRPPVLE